MKCLLPLLLSGVLCSSFSSSDLPHAPAQAGNTDLSIPFGMVKVPKRKEMHFKKRKQVKAKKSKKEKKVKGKKSKSKKHRKSNKFVPVMMPANHPKVDAGADECKCPHMRQQQQQNN